MEIRIPADGVPGLILHRDSQTDVLARGLAANLASPLSDPFAVEVVSVPTPGVERWLSQTLATFLGSGRHGDGVAAGIEFVRIDTLLRGVVESVLGLDPAADPWHPQRGIWAVLRVMDANLDEPWAAPLRAHLVPAATGSKRYATAARVFRLFRSYAAQRPEMVDRWRVGEITDAHGGPLPPGARWQAELWRALRADAGGPDPVERIAHAVTALTDEPGRCDLPGRLSVFGPTRLAPDHVALLSALARHRAVHVWLPHPSPLLWNAIAAVGGARGPRSADPTTVVPRHRLNRRLARDIRELQLVLGAELDEGADRGPVPAAHSSRPTGDGSATLLERLQRAIHDDMASPPRRPVVAADDSIRFHTCHGPDRQVEVLREVVLGLLADHPELEPRDIVVMCPDIEAFAPLVSATFALAGLPDGETHPGQALRVRLADRSLRELNPLLGTLQTLLGLGDSRAGLSEVLDLCADPPVARRFGFTDARLERLHELAPASGIRWGLDREHRSRFAMQAYGQNTWLAGVQRMLLGVAMDEDSHHVQGTVVPLADIESSDADLIGRLAELLQRLGCIIDSFTGSRSLGAWITACRHALDLVTDVPAAETWQLTHAWTELSALADTAESHDGDPTPLSPGDIRAVLRDALVGRPSRSNFRTGALTLCTMSPMRSVPHRAVILLGLDDAAFPRRDQAGGDDLLDAQPWIGDRDPRSEDRQVLLDAVLAARDHLVVIYSGANPQTGEARPPAVPVSELRTAIQDLCSENPWPDLEIRHPLQPFSPANFHPDRFSFDPVACRGAAALLRSQVKPMPATTDRTFTTTDLPPVPELLGDQVLVELTLLMRFFAHPARELLRRRAQLATFEAPEPSDEMPIELDSLQSWAIGERMLVAILGGVDPAVVRAAEFCRGDVPPRQRGRDLLEAIDGQVRLIHRAASPWLAAPADSRWLRADLGRWQVTGMVSGLRERTLLRVGYSRLSGRHRLQAWLELLTLKVAFPSVDWRVVTIGKRGRGSVLGPVAESDARARLDELIQLWVRGAGELIPLPPKTAAAYAESLRPGGDQYAAANAWKHECDAVWGRFGYRNWLASLNEQAASATHGGSRRSRFEELAPRVWGPLLDAEGRI